MEIGEALHREPNAYSLGMAETRVRAYSGRFDVFLPTIKKERECLTSGLSFRIGGVITNGRGTAFHGRPPK